MDGEVKATNAELAYQDYLKGMKYKEIAEKYGVTINTVKSWKTRYKWSKDGKKSVHTKTGKIMGEKWEVQQAWDKQNEFLKAQARAQGEFRALVKQYKELAEKTGGKQDAINKLDAILGELRSNAIKQETE